MPEKEQEAALLLLASVHDGDTGEAAATVRSRRGFPRALVAALVYLLFGVPPAARGVYRVAHAKMATRSP